MPLDRRKQSAAAPAGEDDKQKQLTSISSNPSTSRRRTKSGGKSRRESCPIPFSRTALSLPCVVFLVVFLGAVGIWDHWLSRSSSSHWFIFGGWSPQSSSLTHEQAGRIHQERAARQAEQVFVEHSSSSHNRSTAPFTANDNAPSSKTQQAHPPGGGGERPQRIAWLLSFPNSGTSYTSRLVRDVSQTVTASNYADETPRGLQGWREAVFADQPTGPFWVRPEASPQYAVPDEFVLTKTHCGLRCNPCAPEAMAETTYSFRHRCFVTKWVNDNKIAAGGHGGGHHQYSTYPDHRVTRAVHLVRNPFDNVVSRFHLQNEKTGSQYSADKAGFLKYCLSIDYLYTDSESKYMHFAQNKVLSALWMVPCHADFLRYVEWHNLAFWVQHDLQLQSHVLHYEDFEHRFNDTVAELLDFLHLPTRSPATPFQRGKSYLDYYSLEEKKMVRQALQFAASRETWEHIHHYFPA